MFFLRKASASGTKVLSFLLRRGCGGSAARARCPFAPRGIVLSQEGTALRPASYFHTLQKHLLSAERDGGGRSGTETRFHLREQRRDTQLSLTALFWVLQSF